jgi:myo-inositol-1(or 4)-monophosphatase
MNNFSDYTQFAIETAKECGALLMEYYKKEELTFTKKAYNDIATEADIASENKAIKLIRAKYPDHIIYAEESGKEDKSGDYRWIIDPLDGTTNFKHRIPVFAVSIALEIKGEIHCGIVYAPYMNEFFVAEKGKGAYLNDKKISVSNAKVREMSLVATGFLPYKKEADKNLDIWAHVNRSGYQARRLGAASMDLAYTACGRFEAFWEFGLHAWDIAAGLLLVQEAGGNVTEVKGEKIHVESPSILASNGKLHEDVKELIAA